MVEIRLEEEEEEEVEVIYKRRRLSSSSSEGSSSSQKCGRSWIVNDDDDDDEVEVKPLQKIDEHMFPADSELKDEEKVLEEEAESPHNVFTVLTDREVFDCPICLDQLFAPVFQCDNGHIACSSCCSKLNKTKCPFCCLPIHTRCHGLENFLQSIHILCKYARNLCNKTMPYCNKTDHEQVCQHVTCFCPYPSCSFAYIPWLLYPHFHTEHALSTTRFAYNTTFTVSVGLDQNQIFLQAADTTSVFILHHQVLQHGGRAFYLDCIGLHTTFKNMFVYHLAAQSIDDDTDTSLTFRSVPEAHTHLPKHTFTNTYLTVPSTFAARDTGILSLSVCIMKHDPAAPEVHAPDLWSHADAHKVLKVVLNDPAALDCSICLEPLWTPVFQCENAHLACSSCCSKLESKCSCCGYNYNRCRGLEKVIESIGKISCKYAKYGCKERMPYNEKRKHEKDCPHTTCFCPHPSSCSFASTSENLYLHFGIKHAADITRFTYNTTFSLCVDINQEHVFLQEQCGSVIFILNHQLQKQGRVFHIDCVGTCALKNLVLYSLTAKGMGTSHTLKCVPEIYTKWSKPNEVRKNHLRVPPDFVGYDGILTLSICITGGREALEWYFFGDA